MLNVTHGIGARFKCAVYSADNEVVRSTPEFKNLVLDSGLDRMSVGTWFNRVLVGSGNSEPDKTQTGLDTFVKSTGTRVGVYTASRVLGDRPYMDFTSVYRFPQGAAKGNLSEIAIGWEDNACWNRTLIKDFNGDPTVLTVLEDEFLEVTVVIRVYFQKDITGTLEYKDRNGAVVSTHTVTGQLCLTGDGQSSPSYQKVEWGSPSYGGGGAHLYNQSVNFYEGNYTQAPTGGEIASEQVFRGIHQYPNPRTCRGVRNLNLDNANGNHKALFSYIRGLGADSTIGYKFLIDPVKPKKSTEVMSYTFECSWARSED